jgi:hypothetical protein
MKRVVLSGGLMILCIISSAQGLELYKFSLNPGNSSFVKTQNQSTAGRYLIDLAWFQNTVFFSKQAYSLSRELHATGKIKLNNDLTNKVMVRGINITIYLNPEYVPDLSEVIGKPFIWKISQRGLYLTSAGKPDLVRGIYFDLPKNSYYDYAILQGPKGEMYTPVPAWPTGQYLPVYNSSFYSNGRLDFRLYGTLPRWLYHNTKTGK